MAPIPRTPRIATYNHGDLARGIELTTFYGGNWAESNNVSGQLLSENVFYSQKVVLKSVHALAGTITKIMEKNFDLGFGLPRTILGDLIVNVPFGIGDAAAGAETRVISLSGQLLIQKIDGKTSAVSELGNKHTETYNLTIGDNEQASSMFTLTFPITNTKFRKDDTLRVNVHLWANDDQARNAVIGIGCDPQNRNDPDTPSTPGVDDWKCIPDANNTIMTVQIPFKVDDS